MQALNFEQFKSGLKTSTKKVFQRLTKEHDDICAFGLYSDESAMSISISYNTKKHFKEIWESDPDEKESYRWSPGDWFCESYDISEEFDELNKEISLANPPDETFPTESEFLKFRDNLYNASVEVLQDLKNEGLFNELDDGEFILLFSVSEFEDVQKRIEWVKKLNSDKLSKEFEEWITANNM